MLHGVQVCLCVSVETTGMRHFECWHAWHTGAAGVGNRWCRYLASRDPIYDICVLKLCSEAGGACDSCSLEVIMKATATSGRLN